MNLVVGKFYPPHDGHHYVIDQALADGPTLVVVMYSERESIPVSKRMDWLEDTHRRAFDAWDPHQLILRACRDELPVDFNDSGVSDQHAALLMPMFRREGWVDRISKVFGSEPYIDHLAKYFDAQPVIVDQERIMYPISSTEIRKDPVAHWEHLAPATRADLCKSVVCIGAESCGTTTLARDLAKEYDTVWVPEYGRTYSDGLGVTHNWVSDDLHHIVKMQRQMEQAISRHLRHGLVICDTDSVASSVWDQFLIGYHTFKPYSTADMYIITDFCPWEDDGTRLFPTKRTDMQHAMILAVQATGVPHMLAAGTPPERVAQARKFIDQHLTWDFRRSIG